MKPGPAGSFNAPAARGVETRLGDYDVIAEIARGGMGRVFLARRVGEAGFERLFAIKVLLEDMLDEPEAMTMLLDEANIASRLHHPNVVPIVDIGKDGDGHYLVMEFVDGFSLHDLLRRHKEERPARLLVPILIDALRGLHSAHELRDRDGSSANLVHRDFSPQNLLVAVDGTCRVTDFGIAKVSARLTHTRGGINKGKLAFMSPEQLSAARNIDRRADVWAAGVVLWYALTGEHPFKGESEATTVTNILRLEPSSPSEVGLKPPECLDPVCARALARSRGERYPTAMAMADDLHRLAVRNDLLGAPSEVAEWVKTSFKKELDERREAIRSITSITSLRSLPSLPRPAMASKSGLVRRPKGRPSSVELDLGDLELDDSQIAGWGEPEGGEQAEGEGGASPPTSPASSGPPPVPADAGPDPAELAEEDDAEEHTPPTAIQAIDLEAEEGSGGLDEPVDEGQGLVAAARPPSGRWKLVAGAVAGVILIVVAGLLLTRQPRGEAEPTGDDVAAASTGPAGETDLVPGRRATPTGGDGGIPDAEGDPVASTSDSGALSSGDGGPPGDGAVLVGDGGEPSSDGAAEHQVVRLTLSALPEGASVRLDGRHVEGVQVEVPLDGFDHVIRVDVEGYEQWHHAVSERSDATLEVTLEPRQERRPTKRPRAPAVVRDPGF